MCLCSCSDPCVCVLAVSCVLVYLNEYHVASALYTLQGETRPWVDHITRAQVGHITTPSSHIVQCFVENITKQIQIH